MNENDALQTYHARYNNTTYRAVQTAIVTDLHGKSVAADPQTRDAALATEPTHALMNRFISACAPVRRTPGDGRTP